MDSLKHFNPDSTVRLVPGIRMRREYFGGLIYDTRNGNILEVDKDVFRCIDLLKDRVLKIKDVIESTSQKPTRKNNKTVKSMLADLKGQIERITYTNDENGYTIAKLKVYGYRELVTITGNLLAPSPGEIIKMKGE